MEHNILELLKSRRTIRKFTDEKVDVETVNKILKAGLLAPSSKNKTPVEFIVVRDRDILLKLKDCKSNGVDSLNSANCAIVIIADRGVSDVWIEDASVAGTLIQLGITNLGLGSCWIQIRNRTSNNGYSEEEVRKVLNIPENYGVLCIIALGYKDEEKKAYDEESLDISKIHNNLY